MLSSLSTLVTSCGLSQAVDTAMQEARGSTEYVSNKNVELELKILLVGAPKSIGITSCAHVGLKAVLRGHEME